MEPIEIIVIIISLVIVGSVIGSYIYKKIKHLPTGDCACCSNKMKKAFAKGVKEINKEKCNCLK